MKQLRAPVGCAAAAVMAACAHGGTGDYVFPADDVDSRPVEIACASPDAIEPGTIRGTMARQVASATVEYVVSEEGTVEEGGLTIRTSYTPPNAAQDQVHHRARTAALSCRYEPGTVAGLPVRVRWARRFRFLM